MKIMKNILTLLILGLFCFLTPVKTQNNKYIDQIQFDANYSNYSLLGAISEYESHLNEFKKNSYMYR